MLELFLETGNDEEFFTSTQVNPEKVTITKVVDNDNSDAMEEDEEANGNDTVIETKNRNEKELEVKISNLTMDTHSIVFLACIHNTTQSHSLL